MRVLLTRAAEDAARTEQKLVAAGHEALLSPVIEIAGTDVAWPSGAVDALLATSAHAFEKLRDGPTPEVRRLLPLFLVGERTAKRAHDHGFLGATTVAPNAAGLVLRFGALPSHARVIYLAGRDRKPEVEAAMEASGRHLVVTEIYEARSAGGLADVVLDVIRVGEVDAVLHFSPRSASLFAALANLQGLDTSGLRHLCLSEAVAAPLRKRDMPRIEVAEAPNETALLALLDQA